MEQRIQITRVQIRTANSSIVGDLSLPTNTRLKEFINRNDVWLTLERAQIIAWNQKGPAIPQRRPEIKLQKKATQYIMLLSEDVRSQKGKVYERDVLGARLSKEVFCFVLTGGILVSGEVMGGETTISHHRAGFIAVTGPKITDISGKEAQLEPDFVLINLSAIEYYEKHAASEESDLRCTVEESKETKKPPESMDFSDFENQFVTIEAPTTVVSEPES